MPQAYSMILEHVCHRHCLQVDSMVTHYIVDTQTENTAVLDIIEDVVDPPRSVLVTPKWAKFSLMSNTLLPASCFSTKGLFAGVVANGVGLSDSDYDKLWGLLVGHGGDLCRNSLNASVITHTLVALTPGVISSLNLASQTAASYAPTETFCCKYAY